VHPGKDLNLQLTRSNYLLIRSDPERFRGLGMQVWLPPFDQVMAEEGA
jgi:hypothetical protein